MLELLGRVRPWRQSTHGRHAVNGRKDELPAHGGHEPAKRLLGRIDVDLPGRPRQFGHAGELATLAIEKSIVKAMNPFAIGACPGVPRIHEDEVVPQRHGLDYAIFSVTPSDVPQLPVFPPIPADGAVVVAMLPIPPVDAECIVAAEYVSAGLLELNLAARRVNDEGCPLIFVPGIPHADEEQPVPFHPHLNLVFEIGLALPNNFSLGHAVAEQLFPRMNVKGLFIGGHERVRVPCIGQVYPVAVKH